MTYPPGFRFHHRFARVFIKKACLSVAHIQPCGLRPPQLGILALSNLVLSHLPELIVIIELQLLSRLQQPRGRDELLFRPNHCHLA